MLKGIVITGATSSIGCALIEECINQGIRVLAIANKKSPNIKWIPQHDLVSIVECSLEEFCDLDYKGDSEYDAFVHLAWASTAGAAARNMLQPQAMNIKYSLDAVELAARMGCRVFLGAGSQAEYGRTDKILTESTETNPETGYGMAKLCAGQITRLACQQKSMQHIWIRILSAYGPKCQPQSVVNYTITELLNGRIPSLSKGEQIWDFIYTGDVARAILLLLEKGNDGETYVIGSGKAHKLSEYLLRIKDIINPSIKLGFGDVEYAPNAVMHLACNISKLTNDTGFIPSVEFDEGIKRTAEWIKNELGYIKKED